MYRWFKNGIEFEADDRFQCLYSEIENTISLVFQNVKPSDAGVYTCVAQTMKGRISCSAELKPEKSKAIFKSMLTDFEAIEGEEDIDLNVKLDGSPKPLIRWLFEGKEIKEEDGFLFMKGSDSNSHTLRIKKIDAEMTGVFTCEAFNCQGKSESSGKLTVTSRPKIIEKNFGDRDLEVAMDSNITLATKILGQPTEVIWYRNGRKLEADDDRISFSINDERDLFKLCIKNFLPEDQGEYTLEATNHLGHAVSSCHVVITNKPCFRRHLQDQDVQQNQEDIDFVAELEPLPEIESVKWFVDDIEIIDIDRRYKISSDPQNNVYKLRVKQANEGTAGSYACIATNAYGKSYSTAVLRVTSPPEFMQGLEDREAVLGESVSMDVVVCGSPKPRVQWFKNNRLITGSNDSVKIEQESDFVHILTVEKMKEDSAEYECVITNDFGESRTKGKLTIINEDGTPAKGVEASNFKIDVEDIPDKQQEKDAKQKGENEEENEEEYEEEYEDEEEDEPTILEQEELIPGFDDDLDNKETFVRREEELREQEEEITQIERKQMEEEKNHPSNEVDSQMETNSTEMRDKSIPENKLNEEDSLGEVSDENEGARILNGITKESLAERKVSFDAKVIKHDKENGSITTSEEYSDTSEPVFGAPLFLEGLQLLQERFDGGQIMAELKARITGFPTPDLQWYVRFPYIIHDSDFSYALRFLNDKEIDPVCSKYNLQYNQDDGNIRLVMRRVRPSDAGLYTLKISNAKGCETSTTELIPEPEQRKMSFISLTSPASVFDCNNNFEYSRITKQVSKEPNTETKEGLLSRVVSSAKNLFSSQMSSSLSDERSSRTRQSLLPLEVTPEGKYKINPMSLVVGGAAVLSGLYFVMRLVFPTQLQECGEFSHDVVNNVQEWMFKCTALNPRTSRG
jgi:hypothetical protein